MIDEYYDRKVQRVKCPVCGRDVRITGDIMGSKKGHRWTYAIQEGRVFKDKVVYPLFLICEVNVIKV